MWDSTHLYQLSTSSLHITQHTGEQLIVVGAHLARGGHGGVWRAFSDVSFVAALVVRGEEEAHSGAGQRKWSSRFNINLIAASICNPHAGAAPMSTYVPWCVQSTKIILVENKPFIKQMLVPEEPIYVWLYMLIYLVDRIFDFWVSLKITCHLELLAIIRSWYWSMHSKPVGSLRSPI